MKHVKATVVMADSTRVTLHLICATRADADRVIDELYPDHQYASCIVKRKP